MRPTVQKLLATDTTRPLSRGGLISVARGHVDASTGPMPRPAAKRQSAKRAAGAAPAPAPPPGTAADANPAAAVSRSPTSRRDLLPRLPSTDPAARPPTMRPRLRIPATTAPRPARSPPRTVRWKDGLPSRYPVVNISDASAALDRPRAHTMSA